MTPFQRFWHTINSLTSRLTITVIGLLGLMLFLAWLNYTQINKLTYQKNYLEQGAYTTVSFLRELQASMQQTMHNWQNQLLEPKEDMDNIRRSVWQNEVNVALDSLEQHKFRWGQSALRKKYEETRLNLRKFQGIQDDVVKVLREEQEKKQIDKEVSAFRFYQQRGKALYSVVRVNINEMHHLLTQYYEEERQSFDKAFVQTWFITALSGFLALALGIVLAIALGNRVASRANALASYAKMLSDGNLPKDLPFTNDETGTVALNLQSLTNQLKQLKEFAEKIKIGEFSKETPLFYEHSELGIALREMYKGLNEITLRDMERNRTNEGIALFSNLLREYADAQSLYDALIKNLVKYLNANQGAIFVLQEAEEDEEFLELKSVYAYDRKRFIEKKIARGQGLIGQIWLEKEPVYMPQVPANYTEVSSGLGGAAPRAVLLMPMINNEGQVLGVLEVASLHLLQDYEIAFVKSVGEMIVSAIASIKSGEKTQGLLQEAQRISDLVQAQEDGMRHEMQSIINQRNQYGNQNQLLQTRFQDFDKSLNLMELDLTGSIFRANEPMLEVLGYEEDAIFNENISKLVGERVIQSTAFQHLWQNVLEGIAQNQQLAFYPLNGNPLHFWVHFVPLRNEKDIVTNIVAIATDITSVQNSLDKAQKRWSAIRQIFYYIEFTPFGIVQEANQPYLKAMGRSLGQIRNQPHTTLLPAHSLQKPHNQEFWHELSQGKAQLGNYVHLTSKGESMQLLGVYYPIFNVQKQIESVIFLAQPAVQELATV